MGIGIFLEHVLSCPRSLASVHTYMFVTRLSQALRERKGLDQFELTLLGLWEVVDVRCLVRGFEPAIVLYHLAC